MQWKSENSVFGEKLGFMNWSTVWAEMFEVNFNQYLRTFKNFRHFHSHQVVNKIITMQITWFSINGFWNFLMKLIKLRKITFFDGNKIDTVRKMIKKRQKENYNQTLNSSSNYFRMIKRLRLNWNHYYFTTSNVERSIKTLWTK